MAIKRFVYSDNKKITAIKSQPTGNFVWVAYGQDIDGVCILEKQFGGSPDQTYYTIERDVDEIVSMDLNSTHLFVAYDDSLLLGEKFLLSNPLTTTIEISKPSGIVESPVDVHINGTDVWFLLPGIVSGEIAKLLRYNTSGVLQETIELTHTGEDVYNASTFAIDANGDIWIVTNESPAKVVRVFLDGIWQFQITEII